MCDSYSMDAQAISDFVQSRGITRLVHFTPYLNLCGIFNLGGIWPRERIREYAQENTEEYLMDYIKWNDQLRLDKREDCINLSIQRINTFLFKRFKDFPHGKPWCILEIDPICMQRLDVSFTIANAASTWVRRYGTQKGITGLKELYADSINDGRRVERRGSHIPMNCPTSVQAEVLYPGVIDISLIKGLVFESDEGARQTRGMLKTECPSINLPPIKVSPSDFI